MLALVDHLIDKGTARTQGDALEQIGFNQANIAKIKSGKNKFTVEQIEEACKKTGVSANWIFGFDDTMMRKPGKKAIDQLREAVKAVETALKSG